MDDEDLFWVALDERIDTKVKNHEKRVGWVSGVIGLALIFGIFHAFWILRAALAIAEGGG